MYLLQLGDFVLEMLVLPRQTEKFLVVMCLQQSYLLLKYVLAFLGPPGQMNYDLSADTPSEFPNIFSHLPLLQASSVDQPNQLLHADSHYHMFVLEGLLVVAGRMFEFLFQPVLKLPQSSPVSKSMLKLLGRVVAGTRYLREMYDHFILDLFYLLPDSVRDLKGKLRRGELWHTIHCGSCLQLCEVGWR